MSNRVVTKITDTTSLFLVKNFFSLYIDMSNMNWKLITSFGTFEGDEFIINSKSVCFKDAFTSAPIEPSIDLSTSLSLGLIFSEPIKYQGNKPGSRFVFTVGIRNQYRVTDMIKKFKQYETDKMIHLVSKTYTKFIDFIIRLQSKFQTAVPFNVIHTEIFAVSENDIKLKIDSTKLKYTSKILDIHYYNSNREISLQMEDGNTVLIRSNKGEYPRKVYNIIHCNSRRTLGRNDFHILKYLMNNVKTGRIV